MGKCVECGAWNSLVEERVTVGSKSSKSSRPSSQPTAISEITLENYRRQTTDVEEFDRVLGGGLVPGSAVLLGGEPGVGKSTILLQLAAHYAKNHGKVLYLSGEESASQIGLRAKRLEVEDPNLLVAAETSLENIITFVKEHEPTILILDSIQTVQSAALDSQPGSVGQLRECAFALIQLAKERDMATFLVGHVTKEGSIAGPKVLEHMVDVVLYFESTTTQNFRLLRSIKNRFGSTNEVGVFELSHRGLEGIANPSEIFLAERPLKVPGSVITATQEGTRSLLVEVQALVSHSGMPMPRRTAMGVDPNRVSLLVAILEKRGGYRLFDQDVFVNVAGGLRLSEPAVDLAICAALLSSFSGKPAPTKAFFFGEVGLGGEIRSVPRSLERIHEAARVGFTFGFVPEKLKNQKDLPPGVELKPLAHIQELADQLG